LWSSTAVDSASAAKSLDTDGPVSPSSLAMLEHAAHTFGFWDKLSPFAGIGSPQQMQISDCIKI
jgi:hypothetical protein